MPARPGPPTARNTPPPPPPGDLIAEDIACANCSYNLKGLRVGGPCPECGRKIPQPAPASRPISTPKGRPAPSPPRKAPLGDTLPDDAACSHCKYSLRGLRAGGRRPECGTPIAFRRRRHRLDDHLTDAFPSYLKTLAVGCWLMFGGALVTGACLMLARATFNPYPAAAAGVSGLFWWAGVWIVTRPRQTAAVPRAELEQEWLRCRWFARLTQIGWAVAGVAMCGLIFATRAAMTAAIMNVLPYAPTPAVRSFESLAYLGNFAGLIGIIPLCLVLAGLADWAGHDSLAGRCRASAYLLTMGTVATALSLPVVLARGAGLFGPAAFIVYTIFVLGFLSFLTGMLFLLFSLAQLAGMSLWAISNAETRAESDRRIAERRHEFAERLADRSARAGANPAPPPVNPVQGAGATGQPGGPVRETYALEPEDPGLSAR